MSGELNGTGVLLQVDTGSGFLTIGGQQALSVTLTNQLIDITSKSSNGFRQLLDGEGLQSKTVSLEILFNSSTAYDFIRTMASDKSLRDFQIADESRTYETFKLKVVSFQDISDQQSPFRAVVEFQSSGVTEYPEPPEPPNDGIALYLMFGNVGTAFAVRFGLATKYDASGVEDNDSSFLSIGDDFIGTVRTPWNADFNPSGSKFVVSQFNTNAGNPHGILQYALTDNTDISTGSLEGSYDPVAEGLISDRISYGFRGCRWINDGLGILLAYGKSSDDVLYIYEFALSDAYDIRTITSLVSTFSPSFNCVFFGMDVDPSENYLFISVRSGSVPAIYRYDLSTAGDFSTIGLSPSSALGTSSIAASIFSGQALAGFEMNPQGTKFYLARNTNLRIYVGEFTMTTPFDIGSYDNTADAVYEILSDNGVYSINVP